MQNIKRVFILFLRIIHRDFRSSYLEPSTLKRLHWIRCLVKNYMLSNNFFILHLQVCVCVGKTEKQQSFFKTLRYLTCEQLLLRLQKVFKFQTVVSNSQLFLNVLYLNISIQYLPSLESLRYMKFPVRIGIGPLGSLHHSDSHCPKNHFFLCFEYFKIIAH